MIYSCIFSKTYLIKQNQISKFVILIKQRLNIKCKTHLLSYDIRLQLNNN